MTLLEVSRELGLKIESLCGGAKGCGKCKVRVEEGYFERMESRPVAKTFLLSPRRNRNSSTLNREPRDTGLPAPRRSGEIFSFFVPEESRAGKQVIRKEARDIVIHLNPAVTLHFLELSAPTFQDPLGDFDRLQKALTEKYGFPSVDIDYHTFLRLPQVLRQAKWKVTVAIWMGKEIVDVKPGKVDDAYGLAVDIGTTTVAVYLCKPSKWKGDLDSIHDESSNCLWRGRDVENHVCHESS